MSALEGIRIIELPGDSTAFAGKLLADMGADAIVVEPPGGAEARAYPPFRNDQPDAEQSLHWWHFYTSRRGITLDLASEAGAAAFRELIAGADVLLTGADGVQLPEGLSPEALAAANPRLVHAHVSGFGRNSERRDEPVTDLTILAGAGVAWSCGYDDHELPPIRGRGFQGFNTAAHYAVMAVLTALLYREGTGEGQFIDVSQHAAANITTEMATYSWLVEQSTVQRQTGRHATTVPSSATQAQTADGRYVNTGVLPRTPREFKGLLDWVEDLGLRDEFPEAIFLEMAAGRDSLDRSMMAEDEEIVAMFMVARDAMSLIASRLSAKEFFLGAQRAGIPAGAVYSPEEAFEDEHFAARGFQQPLEHPELNESFLYPGAPYRFEKSRWSLSRRAPLLGEHTEEVLGEAGMSDQAILQLREAGVI
jgi:crotonobetainyl-CoA:carnitine CoA-transferase CaiB-like acyl-CoA transferase